MSTLTAAVDPAPGAGQRPGRPAPGARPAGCLEAPHEAGDAALLVTELVADVVDHVAGQASFALELSLAESWLRIAVVDGSALRPVVRQVEVGAPRERDMRLVEGIAGRWRVEDHADGKAVWFELAAPPP